MSSIKESGSVLEHMNVPVQLKLAASWAALMFLYAYGDIFAYFRPGFIEDVMAGRYLPSRSTSCSCWQFRYTWQSQQ
jgi:hypothetical protein